MLVRDNGKIVTRIDKKGFTYSDDTNKRILIGKHPKTGDMVLAITKNGFDVIEELNNGWFKEFYLS